MGKRRLSVLDGGRKGCCTEFCRAIPCGAFAGFIVSAASLVVFTTSKVPITAALRKAGYSHGITDALDVFHIVFIVTFACDVLAVFAGVIASGCTRECVFRNDGWMRCCLGFCCMPCVNILISCTVLAALMGTYLCLSANILAQSFDFICGSGEGSIAASQKLADAILAARKSEFDDDVTSIDVPDFCKDILALGAAPILLFASSMTFLLGQVFLLVAVQQYAKQAHLEMTLFDSKYGPKGAASPRNTPRRSSAVPGDVELATVSDGRNNQRGSLQEDYGQRLSEVSVQRTQSSPAPLGIAAATGRSLSRAGSMSDRSGNEQGLLDS